MAGSAMSLRAQRQQRILIASLCDVISFQSQDCLFRKKLFF